METAQGEDLKHSGSGDEDATLDDQIERVGVGKFQYLTMFVLSFFMIADDMELVVTNVTWGVLPHALLAADMLY
jgi:hypothetical protein